MNRYQKKICLLQTVWSFYKKIELCVTLSLNKIFLNQKEIQLFRQKYSFQIKIILSLEDYFSSLCGGSRMRPPFSLCVIYEAIKRKQVPMAARERRETTPASYVI